MEIRISWTQLRLFSDCKQKLKLYREHKSPKISDYRVFFPGTVTDRVVRDWLMDDPYSNQGQMPHMVEDIMARELENTEKEGGQVRWKSKDDREEVLRDCIEAVTIMEPILNRLVLPFEYQADFKFDAPLQVPFGPDNDPIRVHLIGAVDVIVRDGESWDIWDVKHTRNDDYWRKTAGQLTFYDVSRILMFEGNSRRSGLFQPLCKEHVKPYPVTDELRSQMMQRITSMVSSIVRADFPAIPKYDSMCNVCDLRHACSKFEPVIVDGKRKVNLLGGINVDEQ